MSSKRINTSKEEREDRIKYSGLTDQAAAMGETYVGPYAGSFAWSSRLSQLEGSVNKVRPAAGKHLNFSRSSSLSGSTAILSSGPDQVGLAASRSGYGESDAQSNVSTERPWYERPTVPPSNGHVSTAPVADFDIPFITSLTKSIPITQVLDSSECSNSQDSSASYAYKNHCFLPSAASLVDPDSSIVSVSVLSTVVVAYYGSRRHGRGGSLSQVDTQATPVEMGDAASLPVTNVVVYKTDVQSFSTMRWVGLTVCCPGQVEGLELFKRIHGVNVGAGLAQQTLDVSICMQLITLATCPLLSL